MAGRTVFLLFLCILGESIVVQKVRMKTTNLIAALTGAVLLFGMSNCSRSYPPLPEGTTEIFVPPSGNDSNPGTLEKPLGSIHQAVQKLEAGMTVRSEE